jgi:hypothetical protein
MISTATRLKVDGYDLIDWLVILKEVERLFRNPHADGIKIDTVFGEIRIRHGGPLFIAWINGEGMASGTSARLTLMNLIEKVAERQHRSVINGEKF